jgi:AraC family transcriptional regulator
MEFKGVAMNVNDSNQRYRILRSLRADEIVLTKSLYAPGQFPMHFHENARLVFVLKGAFAENYAGRSRHCRAPLTIFRPPGEKHWEEYDPGVLCLSVDLGVSWMDHLREYQIRLVDSGDFRSGPLSLLAVNLHSELIINDQASPVAVEGLLLEAAVEIFRHRTPGPKESTPRWLLRARDFIDAEFVRNLTLTEISLVAGVHPVHLARVFRREFGCTIAVYLRRRRVEAACTAITDSDASFAEIATATGFSDQSHFCKLFKRFTRMTPTEYRSHSRSR